MCRLDEVHLSQHHVSSRGVSLPVILPLFCPSNALSRVEITQLVTTVTEDQPRICLSQQDVTIATNGYRLHWM